MAAREHPSTATAFQGKSAVGKALEAWPEGQPIQKEENPCIKGMRASVNKRALRIETIVHSDVKRPQRLRI